MVHRYGIGESVLLFVIKNAAAVLLYCSISFSATLAVISSTVAEYGGACFSTVMSVTFFLSWLLFLCLLLQKCLIEKLPKRSSGTFH